MRIVIFGGGPGAVSIAVNASRQENLNAQVTLWEPAAGKIDRNTKVLLPSGEVEDLKSIKIVNSPAEAVPNADLLILSNPYNTLPHALEEMVPYVTSSLKLILGAPAASGFDWMVREAFARYSYKPQFAAIESLPTIAKKIDQKTVKIYVFKDTLHIAFSGSESPINKFKLEDILGVKLTPLNNFLSLNFLNPGAKVNPLLFLEAIHNYEEGRKNFPYHLGPVNASRLSLIEEEINNISQKITLDTGLDVGKIKNVKEWLLTCYPHTIVDCTDAQTCLSSNTTYQEIEIDFLEGIKDGCLSRKSRYLTEQIPYGLVAIKGLAELFGVPTPTIAQVIRDCEPFLDVKYIDEQYKLIPQSLKDTSSPQAFGIDTASKLSRIYQPTSKNLKVERQEFKENGFTFCGKILPDNVFKELESKVAEVLKTVPEKDTKQSLLNLHWKDPWFLGMCSRKEFTDIACALLGEKKVKIFSSLIVVKPPYGKMVVPWHQDAAYDWPLEPIECVSVWVALDDTTIENGAMTFVKKGHTEKFPMEKTPQKKEGEYFFAEQLEMSIPSHSLQGLDQIQCTMMKQECSFHHIMTPHSSPINKTGQRRCAFIVRFCRENAFLKKYDGMPREEFFKDYKLYETYNENLVV